MPGGKVWYRVMGSGDRTPLLLLHGCPGGRSCGFSTLPGLAQEGPVILYDQLGSGRSERPTDCSLWRTARFVGVRSLPDLPECVGSMSNDDLVQ